jgi:hypothetical protein
MKWYSKCLRAMYVCKARWVGDDRFRNERPIRIWIRLDAGPPTPFEHFEHHLAFPGYLTIANACKLGDYTGIVDHVLLVLAISDFWVVLELVVVIRVELTAISCSGSPPMGKKSSPASRTKDSNTS